MCKNYKRICISCGSNSTKKDGKRRGRQSYKCNGCGYVWIQERRKKGDIDNAELYEKYALRKQTYCELAKEYGVSNKTIQRTLDAYSHKQVESEGKDIVLLIDTTYFGDIGLMAFKDAWSKKILLYQIVSHENKEAYMRGVSELKEKGRNILAIVCDGKRGLLGGFGDIPTQMCHFHQAQIIRRYITKNPILAANKDLKKIVTRLTKTDRKCFEAELKRRYVKYEIFLKEKGETFKGKKYYIHKRTRSAYFSLKRNIKYLFVYHDYLGEIDIPNTTNAIEAEFSHIKYKVNLHRGLRKDRKLKLIDYILKNRY